MERSLHLTPNQPDDSTLYWTTLDPTMVREAGSTTMGRKWWMAQPRIHGSSYLQLETVGLLWEESTQTVMIVTPVSRLMSWSILMLHWQVMRFSQSTTQHKGNYINFLNLDNTETSCRKSDKPDIFFQNFQTFLIEVLLKVSMRYWGLVEIIFF